MREVRRNTLRRSAEGETIGALQAMIVAGYAQQWRCFQNRLAKDTQAVTYHPITQQKRPAMDAGLSHFNVADIRLRVLPEKACPREGGGGNRFSEKKHDQKTSGVSCGPVTPYMGDVFRVVARAESASAACAVSREHFRGACL